MINIIGTLYDNSTLGAAVYAEQVLDSNWRTGEEGIGNADKKQSVINQYLKNKIDGVQKCKGLFASQNELEGAFPNPTIGEWAIVKVEDQWIVFNCLSNGTWTNSQEPFDMGDVNLENYVTEQEATEFVKKSELATIDGHNLVNGGNDITIEHPESQGGGGGSSIEYQIVSSTNDGLMSSIMYDTLVRIRDVELPSIESQIDAINSLIANNTNLQELIDKYNAIKEFIDNLDPNNPDYSVLDLILNNVADIQNTINNYNTEITQLKNRVTTLENNPGSSQGSGDHYIHVITTQSEYDALESYLQNAIYFIIEASVWKLGDRLPIILSGNDEQGLHDSEGEQSTDDTTWKFGSKFPIKFE